LAIGHGSCLRVTSGEKTAPAIGIQLNVAWDNKPRAMTVPPAGGADLGYDNRVRYADAHAKRQLILGKKIAN